MELEFIDNIDMNLSFIRGDQFAIKFKVKDNNGVYIDNENIEDIIVTCRQYPDLESEILFQKKLSENTIEYDSENQNYEFYILEEDTSNLEYGTYGYDISVVTDNEVQTFTGAMSVVDESNNSYSFIQLEFIDEIGIDLKFARADQFPVRFKIKNKEEEYLTDEDLEDIVITCRQYPDTDSPILFQKRLENGFVVYDDENEYFEFYILEEDTRNLEYGHYGYEIKTMTTNEIQTFTGHIDVADEYTIGVIKKNFYLEDLEVTPTSEEQVFTHDETMGYDLVTVSGVDASVDENIIPSNIKKGVSILGVEGDLTGGTSATVSGSTLILNAVVENEEVII